jgi:hypothetical protein
MSPISSSKELKKMKRLLILPMFAIGLGIGANAHAEDQGCSGFTWPLDTELSWMAAPDGVSLASGAELPSPPAKAITLALEPAKSVTMPVPPGVKKQAVGGDTFSGWLTLGGVAKPGLYQISLSHEGWIDVVQNGALVKSSAFTGRKECAPIHKSVRFEIGAGPVTVQISGAPAQTVKLAIREAN